MNLVKIIEFAKCFSNESRLQLIQLLAERELCVCELESLTGLNQANISQHLRLLYSSGLVEKRRDGQLIYYKLSWNIFEKCLGELKLLVSPSSISNEMRIKLDSLLKDENVTECKCQKR